MKTFTKSSAAIPEGEQFIGEDSPLEGRSDQRERRAKSIHKKVMAERSKAAKNKK